MNCVPRVLEPEGFPGGTVPFLTPTARQRQKAKWEVGQEDARQARVHTSTHPFSSTRTHARTHACRESRRTNLSKELGIERWLWLRARHTLAEDAAPTSGDSQSPGTPPLDPFWPKCNCIQMFASSHGHTHTHEYTELKISIF